MGKPGRYWRAWERGLNRGQVLLHSYNCFFSKVLNQHFGQSTFEVQPLAIVVDPSWKKILVATGLKQRVNMKRSASLSQRRGSVDPSADAALARLGYVSELPRNLSMLSVLGM